MIRNREQLAWWAGGILVLVLSAWGLLVGQSASASPQLDEKTIPLKPSVTFVKASFLTGELRDLRVVEWVEHGTRKTVGGPELRDIDTDQ
jgi:hypothetical protein